MAEESRARLLKEGDKFGDYTVVKLLGKGGMGAVYLMRGASGSEYAVKIMFPDKVTHDLRRRFAKEAEFAIKIRHRNLVSVYDVGEDPDTGLCYMFMDYVPGGSLSDMLKRRGRLPFDEAVSIASQIASALEVAHRHGLVHRDIKPDNILFDADGTPRLADLGVAKFDESQQSMVTTTGMVIGTPAYMAPEQMLNSHAIDARADIYSLGVVLYEMLSGKRPNEGRTAIELMAKAIKGDPLPDIKTICPEVSVAVAHVVSLLCAPKPEARPQTALAAADILRKAASGKLVLLRKRPNSVDVEKRKSNRPFPISMGIVGVLFIVVLMFVWLGLRQRHPVRAPLPETAVVVTNVVERIVTNVATDGNTNATGTSHGRASSPPLPSGRERREFDAVKSALERSLPEGFHSAFANGYFWFYKQEDDKAELASGGEGNCLYPKPKVRVVIPSALNGCKVRAIGYAAFRNCNAMTEIALPEGLEEIRGGNGVFYGCSALRELDFPRSLVKIDGGWIFDECTALRRVNVARYAEYREGSCFGCQFIGCPNIERFEADADNSAYTAVDGVIYTKDMRELVIYPKARGKIVLPKSVNTLGWSSAASLSGKDVIIPDGIEAVKSWAFEKCADVEYVEFPKSLKQVGGHVFRWSGKLKKVVFRGDAPELIEDKMVFEGTTEELVVEVERSSKGWNGPESADLPVKWPVGNPFARAIRYIGMDAQDAQSGSVSRTKKTVSAAKAGSAKSIPVFPILDRSPGAWAYSFEEEAGWNGELFNDSSWKRAPGGFGYREELKQLPRARLNAFWRSDRLFLRKRFTWTGGKGISRVVVDAYHDDDVTFYLNGQLLSNVVGANSDWQPFEIPAERFVNVLRQGENVFCVEVGNHGHSQYFDCGLVVECGGRSTPHAGPDSLRRITTDSGTWTVVVENGIAQIGDGRNVALEPRPKGHLKIPSELGGLVISKLAQGCFLRCEELEGVEIAEGIRSIGEGAFCGCSRLANVHLPSTLEHIGPRAMQDAILKRIDLKNVRIMEDEVFRFCDNLDTVKVSPDNVKFRVKEGVLYDVIRRAVVFCPASRKVYAFPSGIAEIYSSAFRRTKLKKIVIPETVEFVGWDAFAESPFLESVVFKGDDAVIRGGAFSNNPMLKTVMLPKQLKALDDWAIFACAGQLESIMLPATVEVIDDAVFENCPKLRRVTLGNSLRTVRHHAFAGCRNLDSVKFPPSLRELGAEVFLDCSGLKKVLFGGKAPEIMNQGLDRFGKDLYKGTDPSLVTFVLKSTTGWMDNTDKLPKVWPVDGGESARRIRHVK